MPQKSVNDERPIIRKTYRRLSLPGETEKEARTTPMVVTITPAAADRILGAAGTTFEELKKKIEATKKPASRDLPGAVVTMSSTVKTQVVRGINVVGLIEGSDPALKNEAVVIGAHLDHEGRWEDYIYNGSDDNGSGSVGVLNLARAFAANSQKPKRTLVFCLWCGEENGLLGFLPLPDLPMMETNSPSAISRLTPCRARKSPPGVWKVLKTSRKSIKARSGWGWLLSEFPLRQAGGEGLPEPRRIPKKARAPQLAAAGPDRRIFY